jgi:hypothetical protein
MSPPEEDCTEEKDVEHLAKAQDQIPPGHMNFMIHWSIAK